MESESTENLSDKIASAVLLKSGPRGFSSRYV